MLTNLRKRSRLIMIIVAAGFVGGFLLGGTLCDVVRRRGAGRRTPLQSGIVGRVGEHKITVDEYRGALAYMTDKYRTDNRLRDLADEDYASIEDRAWKFLVSEITWGRLFQRSNVRITEEEVFEIMKANPPQELRANPEFLNESGEFDHQKYVQAMENPQNQGYFSNYFRQLVEMLPKEKLQIDVASSYRVSSAEAAEALRATNTRWTVTTLYFGPQLVQEKAGPSEEDARAYFLSHPEEFRGREQRHLAYVFFPLQTSAADSTEAEETIRQAYAQLEAGDEFNLTMLDHSDLVAETTSAPFARSALDAATDSVVATLRPGRYSEPFLASYGWQILMLDSVSSDSVALRRILVRVGMGADEVATVRDSVRDFLDRVKEEDFDSVAMAVGRRVVPARPMIDGKPNLAGLELFSPVQYVDWAKQAKKGEVLGIPQRGPSGFYVFRLVDLIPAQVPEFDDVKPRAVWKVRQQREKDDWLARAEEAKVTLSSGKTLEQYAEENENVQLTTEEFQGLADCQRRRGAEFAGAVLALNQGEVSGVVETDWGAFIIRCDSLEETGVMSAPNYAQQRQQQTAQQVLQTLLEQLEVEDYRDPFAY